MNSTLSPTIAVIGAGAVGTGLAALLNDLNQPTLLLGRTGLQVASTTVDFFGKKINLTPMSPRDLGAATISVKLIFLAVKAYDLEKAADQHLKYFKDAAVVTMCNGAIFSIVTSLEKRYTALSWRFGITDFGVKQQAPGKFSFSNKVGQFAWGRKGKNPNPVESQIFTEKSEIFYWLKDPEPSLRRKWLFNVVINSLCAAYGLATNGALLTAKVPLEDAFKEAFELGEKLWGRWPNPANELFADVKQLIKNTASNENSMVRDLRLGRKTEADFLTGLAVKEIGYPLLKKLHEKIVNRS